MRWIEYEYVCNEKKGIKLKKRVEYSEENLIIAQAEACDGKYNIVNDDEALETKPIPILFGGTGATTPKDALDKLGAAPKNHKHYYDAIVTTGGTGEAYTATIEGLTELEEGMILIMIPHVANTTHIPTLNVNDFGAVQIMRPINAYTTTTTVIGTSRLSRGKPVQLIYNGTNWVAVNLPTINLNKDQFSVTGILSVENGGTGAATVADALKNLGIYTMSGKGKIFVDYQQYPDGLNKSNCVIVGFSFAYGTSVWLNTPNGTAFAYELRDAGWCISPPELSNSSNIYTDDKEYDYNVAFLKIG